MTAQTSYAINQGEAFPGQLYGVDPAVIVSRDAEGSLDFGIIAGRGTNGERQVIPGGAGKDIIGVTIRSLEREGAYGSGLVNYSDKETVGLLQSGYIYATCPTGCAAGDDVIYTDADGILDAGAPAAGQTKLDHARWESDTVAGAVGVLRLEILTGTTAGV